jgi:hypothetical protein
MLDYYSSDEYITIQSFNECRASYFSFTKINCSYYPFYKHRFNWCIGHIKSVGGHNMAGCKLLLLCGAAHIISQ